MECSLSRALLSIGVVLYLSALLTCVSVMSDKNWKCSRHREAAWLFVVNVAVSEDIRCGDIALRVRLVRFASKVLAVPAALGNSPQATGFSPRSLKTRRP